MAMQCYVLFLQKFCGFIFVSFIVFVHTTLSHGAEVSYTSIIKGFEPEC